MYELPEWLHEYLMKFEKVEIIEIMAFAIDKMQAWNGRGITYCVVSSIENAACIENDDGSYTYRLPKKA